MLNENVLITCQISIYFLLYKFSGKGHIDAIFFLSCCINVKNEMVWLNECNLYINLTCLYNYYI